MKVKYQPIQKICVWKKVTINDDAKRNDLEGRVGSSTIPTFKEDEVCVSCNGYVACPTYVPYLNRVAEK